MYQSFILVVVVIFCFFSISVKIGKSCYCWAENSLILKTFICIPCFFFCKNVGNYFLLLIHCTPGSILRWGLSLAEQFLTCAHARQLRFWSDFGRARARASICNGTLIHKQRDFILTQWVVHCNLKGNFGLWPLVVHSSGFLLPLRFTSDWIGSRAG